MEQINTKDKTILDLVLAGYDRAAISFSSLIAQKATINNNKVDMDSSWESVCDFLQSRGNVVALKTRIIGDLRGDSYLFLTEAEMKVICDLTRTAFGGGANIDNDLILHEVDNILAAAVITEISNTLKIKIYGDVPHLIRLDQHSTISALIKNDVDDCYVLSNANFVFDSHAELNPYFLWRFENKILELLDSMDK